MVRRHLSKNNLFKTGKDAIYYDSRALHYNIEKLTAGCCIIIEGKTSNQCSSFTINLRCGEDIAFHINPRFDQRYIARNAKINKSWGQEESQLLQKIPLSKGQDFIIEILVGPSDYMVSIDGSHIFSFGHRIAYSDVKTVEISPEVIISKFTIAQITVYPSIPFEPLELPITYEKNCPIVAKCGPMQIGDLIEVVGRVHSLPHLFYINLQAGFHSIPHPIIAYHLASRYTMPWQIAQNSWSSGRWNEELSQKLPPSLLPGEKFCLVISCLSSGYSSSINGENLKNFSHRVPPATANILLIQGDLTIVSIKSSCSIKK